MINIFRKLWSTKEIHDTVKKGIQDGDIPVKSVYCHVINISDINKEMIISSTDKSSFVGKKLTDVVYDNKTISIRTNISGNYYNQIVSVTYNDGGIDLVYLDGTTPSTLTISDADYVFINDTIL